MPARCLHDTTNPAAPLFEPEQKAGTPVHTQGRHGQGPRRQAQPVPFPGTKPPERFQTERFIGLYDTPFFIKMQSFFSETAWNSPQELPAAHTRIKSGSEPPSAAAAAVISTAAAVPAAAGIPAAPAVSTAAAEDDNQHNDPQAASATPAIIAAPHIEVPPEI